MINITNTAKNKITQLLTEENNNENKFLRISVKAGGCSGLSWESASSLGFFSPRFYS